MKPSATGRRLASPLPNTRRVDVPGARTLVPFGNPSGLTAEPCRFVEEHP
ncbi:hypothetical protein [Streptomyces albus]